MTSKRSIAVKKQLSSEERSIDHSPYACESMQTEKGLESKTKKRKFDEVESDSPHQVVTGPVAAKKKQKIVWNGKHDDDVPHLHLGMGSIEDVSREAWERELEVAESAPKGSSLRMREGLTHEQKVENAKHRALARPVLEAARKEAYEVAMRPDVRKVYIQIAQDCLMKRRDAQRDVAQAKNGAEREALLEKARQEVEKMRFTCFVIKAKARLEGCLRGDIDIE